MGANEFGGTGLFFVLALIIGLLVMPRLVMAAFVLYLSPFLGGILGIWLVADAVKSQSAWVLVGLVGGAVIGWKFGFFIADNIAGKHDDERDSE